MALQVGFRDVVKSFGPVRVLHGVSFDLEPGRVVGLLGENGAGKSTLMKILAGYETSSGGQLLIDGRAQQFADSRAAEAAGIVMIHQEFNLAEDLTVAQNIFLGHERLRGWRLDHAAMRRDTEQVLRQVGLAIDPDTRTRDLIVAEKQLVEIAKALSRQARLLVMDEPTATLTPAETERLFELIRRLRGQGTTIIYISHKLDEVERITDEVVVMRDGRFVARAPTASLSRREMARLMVGRELSDMFPPKSALPDGPPLLQVQALSIPGWATDAGFELYLHDRATHGVVDTSGGKMSATLLSGGKREVVPLQQKQPGLVIGQRPLTGDWTLLVKLDVPGRKPAQLRYSSKMKPGSQDAAPAAKGEHAQHQH